MSIREVVKRQGRRWVADGRFNDRKAQCWWWVGDNELYRTPQDRMDRIMTRLGFTRSRADERAPVGDAEAIERIHRLLDGNVWDVGILEDIAEIVSKTGRTVHDPWAVLFCGECNGETDAYSYCVEPGCPNEGKTVR